MKWDYDKSSDEKSRTEIELTEVFDYVRSLEAKLRKLEAVVDSLFLKASMSHSLIVIRKIEDTKLEKLKDLLD